MMGRSKGEQGQLFYAFDLEAVVPDDHQVRRIAAVLDLSGVRGELAPHYSNTGRPSVDPELMIRMLILSTESLFALLLKTVLQQNRPIAAFIAKSQIDPNGPAQVSMPTVLLTWR